MKVNEMKIADVLVTEEYYKNIKNAISYIIKTRGELRKKYKLIPYRHASDRLIEKGVFEPGQLTQLYAEAMDKKLQGYSSAERKYILEVGGYAFNKTMKELLDEEKKDSSNGNN
jgi:hypothetical protein